MIKQLLLWCLFIVNIRVGYFTDSIIDSSSWMKTPNILTYLIIGVGLCIWTVEIFREKL